TPAPPTVTKVDPTTGETCSVVTITGTNFSATASENTVKFDAETASITSASATELKVTVPQALTVGDSYQITVTVNGQTATAADKFEVTGDGCTTANQSPTAKFIFTANGLIVDFDGS